MAEVEGDTPRWRYRRSVREHVRAPLEAAFERVERERDEVHAEATAFECFAEKVGEITPTPTVTAPQTLADDGDAEKRKAVREAYRETVMALDHYEAVYDEPLPVNVAGELSADVATSLSEGSVVTFSDHLQSTIQATARGAVDRRETFQERLADERASLEDAEADLRELLEGLDGTGLPSWYRPSFDERLDEVIRRRQHHLQSRDGSGRNGHDLCDYVYGDQPWNYPALTAVARLRNSVS